MGCFDFTSKTPQCLCRAGPVLALVLALVFGVFLASTPAAAQSTGNACLKEQTGLNNPSCTANDVRVGFMELISGPETCNPDIPDVIEVTIAATIESGPTRYAIGLWVNEKGGSALSDTSGDGLNCYRDYLVPVDGICEGGGNDNLPCSSDTDCPDGVCPGVCNQLGGPYYNADDDGCGDVYASNTDPCGTAVTGDCSAGETGSTCLFTTKQFTIDITCADNRGTCIRDSDGFDTEEPCNVSGPNGCNTEETCIGDGIADVGTCTSWDINEVGDCLDETGTDPGTGSKCNCNPVNISGLFVDPCIDVDCSVNDTDCATFACDPEGEPDNCDIVTYEPSTTVCRAAAGDCDVEESCTGNSKDCPADAKEPSTTICRADQGLCDGVSNDCPADGFQPSTTICRNTTDICDPAESCTGSGPDCPADINIFPCKPSIIVSAQDQCELDGNSLTGYFTVDEDPDVDDDTILIWSLEVMAVYVKGNTETDANAVCTFDPAAPVEFAVDGPPIEISYVCTVDDPPDGVKLLRSRIEVDIVGREKIFSDTCNYRLPN